MKIPLFIVYGLALGGIWAIEYFLVLRDYCTGGEEWLLAAREISEAKKCNCWKLEIEPASLKIGEEI